MIAAKYIDRFKRFLAPWSTLHAEFAATMAHAVEKVEIGVAIFN
jgi:hypothetical protein